MRFILTAILALIGAEPICNWLMLSSYGQYIWDFQKSVAITSMLGHPDWVLTAAFLMACYGVAGELLCVGYALVPSRRFVCSDVSPFQSTKFGISGEATAKHCRIPK